MKFLIVEDNPDLIESLEIFFELRWAGATIISATNGENGLELAKSGSPDVIILDLGLPDIDGFEMLRLIRNFSDVPIIILTARCDDMDKFKALELGADDYISKPFNPTGLLDRIKAVLCRSHVPEERDASENPFAAGELKPSLSIGR